MKTKKMLLPILMSVLALPAFAGNYVMVEEVDEVVVVEDSAQQKKHHHKKHDEKMYGEKKCDKKHGEKMCDKKQMHQHKKHHKMHDKMADGSDCYFESNISNKDRIKNSHKRLKKSMMPWDQNYLAFKKMLNDELGFSYAIDATIMPQRAAPNGKKTAWQSLYSGVANMDLMKSDWGNASVSAGYTMSRYWGADGNLLDDRIGVVMPINDYPDYSNTFDNLTFNYQGVGMMDWLALSVGQFQIGDFDGSAYNNNQQINFINYGFSQNGSSVYPQASLGAYVTISPMERFAITIGAQDAKNISGNHMEWSNLGDKKYASFANIAYNPVIDGLKGQYSFLMYYQPSVEALPVDSIGWSFNMMQHYTEKMAIMARVNGIDSDASIIRQSYMFGHVINNPFGRNKLDQFGLAYGLNKTNKNFNTERKYENVIEAFYSMGITNCLLLTPDVQFYINPAEGKTKTATAYSLRLTAMF